MSSVITLENMIKRLQEQLFDIWPEQVMEAGDFYGALLHPKSLTPDATHTHAGQYVWAAGLSYLYEQTEATELDLERASLIAESFLTQQRESGLIDLVDCNYESSPDTAFIVQLLGQLLILGRQLDCRTKSWALFIRPIELFLKRSIEGLKTGGFHTPNHRWVIASALVILHELFDREDILPVVEAYLAEGIDINEDGFYLELSSSGYDAVSNWALMQINELHPWEQVKSATRANLNLNRYLFHGDESIESKHSTRWDAQMRRIPSGLATCYLYHGLLYADQHFCEIAAEMIQSCLLAKDTASQLSLSAMNRLAWLMLRFDQGTIEKPANVNIPRVYEKFFPSIGLGRVRDADFSMTTFLNRRELLDAYWGNAGIKTLSIRLGYLGEAGNFIAHEYHRQECGLRMDCHGDRLLGQRAVYYQPLGKPVSYDGFEESLSEREVRQMPLMDASLLINKSEESLSFNVRMNPELPEGIKAQVTMDLYGAVKLNGKQLAFGTSTLLRKGEHSLVIGESRFILETPESEHHMDMLAMSLPMDAQVVRLVMNYMTPVDHRWMIRPL